MQIEIRADGAHISGYVNVTEKKSRPVITPHGRVVEEIEPRAFEQALAARAILRSLLTTTVATRTPAQMKEA